MGGHTPGGIDQGSFLGKDWEKAVERGHDDKEKEKILGRGMRIRARLVTAQFKQMGLPDVVRRIVEGAEDSDLLTRAGIASGASAPIETLIEKARNSRSINTFLQAFVEEAVRHAEK